MLKWSYLNTCYKQCCHYFFSPLPPTATLNIWKYMSISVKWVLLRNTLFLNVTQICPKPSRLVYSPVESTQLGFHFRLEPTEYNPSTKKNKVNYITALAVITIYFRIGIRPDHIKKARKQGFGLHELHFYLFSKHWHSGK